MPADTAEQRRFYGDYEIESLLGKGSIGKVYLARHRRIGRRVALKTIHIEDNFDDDEERDEFYKRLQREAELCGSLQHPNVVSLYEVGYDDEVVSFLATEYVDGESLAARLKRSRPLPLHEAVSISTDLLRGLAYAHEKGIIHRDIKPANILLSAQGQAKLADFGIARPIESSLTASNSLLGTPNYMSPEQVKSTPVTTRSDLFSVGVVMYELLTGVKPFAAPQLSAILYNVVNHDPPLASEVQPSIPLPLAKLVAMLLSKVPTARPPTAAWALQDLEKIRASMGEEPIESTVDLIEHSDLTTPLPTEVFDVGTLQARSLDIPMPAEPTPPPGGLRRPVPWRMFWGIVGAAALAFAGSVVTMRTRIDRVKPLGVITPEQQQNAAVKRNGLAAARQLVEQRRYHDAVAAYDALLARFPETEAARVERAATQRRIEQLATSRTDTEVTSTAKSRKPKSEPPPKKSPPSRWERVKRWFRG